MRASHAAALRDALARMDATECRRLVYALNDVCTFLEGRVDRVVAERLDDVFDMALDAVRPANTATPPPDASRDNDAGVAVHVL
jgi:hypothetical protein